MPARTPTLTLALLLGTALTAAARAATPTPQVQLTQVAAFPHQVTGVAVAPDGRIFVNFPRWTDDAPVSVGLVGKNGAVTPYPNAEWNAWRNARMAELGVADHFVCVQSIVQDGHGSLWVVDAAAPGNEKILPGGPKLVKIDLASNQVTKVIPMPPDVALEGTYLNDIRFSPDARTAYITDSGTRGAIIVVDLDAGTAFRALDGAASTQLDKTVKVTVDDKPLVRPDGRQPSFAADGIALSRDGQTLYWQALTGKTLYSIPTSKLTKGTAAADQEAAVKTEGTTQVADGYWISKAGVFYITSPNDNAVKRWANGTLQTVLSDKRLRWPDTFSEGPDGTMYVTASHIMDTPWFKDRAPASVPTALFSFRPGN